jgi:hypothetical protein
MNLDRDYSAASTAVPCDSGVLDDVGGLGHRPVTPQTCLVLRSRRCRFRPSVIRVSLWPESTIFHASACCQIENWGAGWSNPLLSCTMVIGGLM